MQLLAYADEINIIGTSKRAVNAAFSVIERKSAKVDLSVNDAKTKYMRSTRQTTPRGKIPKMKQKDITLIPLRNLFILVLPLIKKTTSV